MNGNRNHKGMSMLLERINGPSDLRALDHQGLKALANEVRSFIVESVARGGGHLGSNLGAVELTFALHRVFDSPDDVLLWDTGHQSYVHKLVTGRQEGFSHLRQADGLSGYPARDESPHDWVENSHASTALSYAHGLAIAFRTQNLDRRVVAVIGDGAMTGGMAYEALNNLGHSGQRVLIVLNDNGRSYAPTVSRLGESLAMLRLNPSYVSASKRWERRARRLPGVLGGMTRSWMRGTKAALREAFEEPPTFFEALGVRYTGPIDGHDVAKLEHALRHAATYDGPVVVHVMTQKGRGYAPAETDVEKCLHDVSAFDPATGRASSGGAQTYTQVFSDTMVELADRHDDLVAITAAMPGSTGLLPMQERHPGRVLDVGIAEQHAVTSAAGMAMGGLRPVVAVYSTFFTRAFDQANLDVGLHGQPVTFALDRAGITGDDGASHHGVLDMALCLKVPGMTVFAPSSAQELSRMLSDAVMLGGPAAVRFPKGVARDVGPHQVGEGLHARKVRDGTDVCFLAVGKLLEAAEDAAEQLAGEGVSAAVWDVRVVKPADPAMLHDAARYPLVVTVEDGTRVGGAGAYLRDAVGRLDETQDTPRFLVLGTPDRYIPQAKPQRILTDLGLDGPGVAAATRKAVAAPTP
ncbi:MAG: 1-deoxy-D-xylulose-5-phosphate synthase [Actinomycetota bacterium]|nr:1-deoxy-D-xylulose-5-phosphate synthase [Actinomycetota bacterium]